MVAYYLFHCIELYIQGWFKRWDFWFVARCQNLEGSLEFSVIFVSVTTTVPITTPPPPKKKKKKIHFFFDQIFLFIYWFVKATCFVIRETHAWVPYQDFLFSSNCILSRCALGPILLWSEISDTGKTRYSW